MPDGGFLLICRKKSPWRLIRVKVGVYERCVDKVSKK